MLKVKKMLNFIEHIMSTFFCSGADQYKAGPPSAEQTGCRLIKLPRLLLFNLLSFLMLLALKGRKGRNAELGNNHVMFAAQYFCCGTSKNAKTTDFFGEHHLSIS